MVDLWSSNTFLRSPEKSAFVPNFINPQHAASMEKHWSSIEDRAPKALSSVDQGTLFSDPNSLRTIVDLIALHLMRSHQYHALWQQFRLGHLQSAKGQRLLDWIDNPRFLDGIFRDLTGLQPVGIEAREIARNYCLGLLRAFDAGEAAFAEHLRDSYDRTRVILSFSELSIGTIDADDLIISDVPAVTFNVDGFRVGFAAGVPLHPDSQICMPLGPRHLAITRGSSTYSQLHSSAVAGANMVQLLSAKKHAFARPGSDRIAWIQELARKRKEVQARDAS